MVPHRAHRKDRRPDRGAVQFIQRWCAGELRSFFARYHALHQCVDHDAAADGGDPAVEPARARRRRPPENNADDALRHARSVHFPGLHAGRVISAPRVVSHHSARNHRHDPTARHSLGRRSRLDVSDCHRDLAHHRHAFSHVARRPDHRARHRQRHFAHYHHRHRCAPARRARPGLENVCAQRRRGHPG